MLSNQAAPTECSGPLAPCICTGLAAFAPSTGGENADDKQEPDHPATGKTPIPRTTLALRVRKPNQSSPW
jgi:hypothetical protein